MGFFSTCAIHRGGNRTCGFIAYNKNPDNNNSNNNNNNNNTEVEAGWDRTQHSHHDPVSSPPPPSAPPFRPLPTTLCRQCTAVGHSMLW